MEIVREWTLSVMMSKIKMAVIVWGLCTEGLWRGCYDSHEEIMGYIWMRHIYYHPTVMHVFCLVPLKFLAGFVIPDAIE